MKTTKTLIHTSGFSVNMEDQTQANILDYVNNFGFRLGRTSLQSLVSGKMQTSCGFSITELAGFGFKKGQASRGYNDVLFADMMCKCIAREDFNLSDKEYNRLYNRFIKGVK